MMKYPNQRTVTVIRNLPNRKQNKNKPFIYIYCSSVEQAAKNLNGGQFKLWLYFASNQNNYKQAFSPQAVKDSYGMSLDTIRTAFKELVKKKYLVLEEGTKSKYLFYEVPLQQSRIKVVEEKRIFFDQDSNQNVSLTFSELLEALKDEQLAQKFWLRAKVAREEKQYED